MTGVSYRRFRRISSSPTSSGNENEHDIIGAMSSRDCGNECSKTILDIRELFPSDLQSLDNGQINDVHIFRKPATRAKFATLSIRVRDGASTCQSRLAIFFSMHRNHGTVRCKFTDGHICILSHRIQSQICRASSGRRASKSAAHFYLVYRNDRGCSHPQKDNHVGESEHYTS